MFLLIYNIVIFLFGLLIRLASVWDGKARQWVNGRRNWRQQFKQQFTGNEKRIWIHASSLGEFEQGRPLIEQLRKDFPSYKIVLSFFSPSGYEVMNNYDKADHIVYLPLDTSSNAKDFISIIQPSLAIFIKYEFWYHYMHVLKKKKIPVMLISAAFRKEQPFFKWYGGIFRNILDCYDALFVQNEDSKRLLATINIHSAVTVAGDTRYDRVANIASSVKTILPVEEFKGNSKLLIAGSTWPDDEQLLKDCLNVLPGDWKLVIAPHEIDQSHINKIADIFERDLVFYSKHDASLSVKKILVIDNIGMLSSLYSYGEVAYIGGGFQKGGIHNILEPAVFGLPVVFGPVYEKFVEASTMVSKGYAFPVHNKNEAARTLESLISDHHKRSMLQQSIRGFMQQNIGATRLIMDHIRENNLL